MVWNFARFNVQLFLWGSSFSATAPNASVPKSSSLLFCNKIDFVFFACRLNNRKKRDENLFGSKEWHFTLLFSINALINQCLNHWCLHWFHVITHWRERNEKQLIPFILFFFKWFYSMAWIFIYSNYSNFVC